MASVTAPIHSARLLRGILPALLLLALAVPGSAWAARGAETSIMDDQLLLNATTRAEVDREMAIFKALGVDRLRVSAFWNQIAPFTDQRQKPPAFDGSNHLDPRYTWAPLDRVVASAATHGLRVMVSISMPAPIWATGATRTPNPLWKPSVAEFADFSEAVARRYGPAVDHYGVSNEPNQHVWLLPQADRRGPYAPHLYRRMVQASYPRIKAVDPDSVVLIGELAASGRKTRRFRDLRPLRFLRAMACRDRNNRRIRRGRCRNFSPVPADAIGHHPYQLLLRPGTRSSHPDDAAINDGRRLLRLIDRLTRRGALRPGGGRRRLNVFYTEFGYQTSPPDPFAGVSLGQQSRYLQQAAYLTWKTPRIRGLNQFRLTDGDLTGTGTERFKEFQSGLMFRNRRRKPSYGTFPDPFVISGDRFWGQVRPGGRHIVRVHRRRNSRGRFRLVAQVITNTRGYFSFRLPGRRAGHYQYRYANPSGRSGIVRVPRR